MGNGLDNAEQLGDLGDFRLELSESSHIGFLIISRESEGESL